MDQRGTCLTMQSFVVNTPAPRIGRRRRRAPSPAAVSTSTPRGNKSATALTFVLVVLQETGSIHFCHSQSESLVSENDDDSVVLFDASVSVEMSQAAEPCLAGLTKFGLQDLTRQENDSWRAKVGFDCDNNNNNSAISYVYTLPNQTIAEPLLSLSCTVERIDPPLEKGQTVESQPLLLTCLKSMLVGTFILHKHHQENNTIESVIRVKALDRTFWFRTKSLLAVVGRKESSSSQQQPQLRVYRIMPSTKITMLSNPELLLLEQNIIINNNKDDESSSPHLSATARYLVDTLRCLQHAAPSASSPSRLLRFVLLSGPPGTGKTFAVKCTVQVIAGCQLVSIQGSQIMAVGHVGQAIESLQKSFQKARSNSSMGPKQEEEEEEERPGLIFLDEFDALVSSSSSSEAMSTALGVLMDKISHEERRPVMLVAATNRVDDIPAALRRRFDHEIVMTPPRAEERCQILTNLLKQAVHVNQTQFPSAQELLELARDCVGCVPSDLAAIVRKATLVHVQQDPSQQQPTMLLDHLRQASILVGASALRDAAIQAPPRTHWDDIAGDAGGAKKALRQAIEWPRTRKAAFEALGLTPPRGILLHGPPGCAKTTAARAAAGAAGVAFLSLGPADVYASSFVGDAEAVIRRAFTLARAASPCILFFDEIDAIIGAPTDDGDMNMARGSSAEARVLSTFLNEMDGVDQSPVDGVLVLGATNRPWTLDAALLRPGRLDKIIYVPPPDREARLALLERQTNGWPITGGISGNQQPLDLDRLADISESMTGAEIVGACRDAARAALRQNGTNEEHFSVDKQLLEDALLQVKPLLHDDRLLEQFRRFEEVHKR